MLPSNFARRGHATATAPSSPAAASTGGRPGIAPGIVSDSDSTVQGCGRALLRSLLPCRRSPSPARGYPPLLPLLRRRLAPWWRLPRPSSSSLSHGSFSLSTVSAHATIAVRRDGYDRCLHCGNEHQLVRVHASHHQLILVVLSDPEVGQCLPRREPALGINHEEPVYEILRLLGQARLGPCRVAILSRQYLLEYLLVGVGVEWHPRGE
mmetsp:Transcript_21089/g.50894  ORF Transcript_21089/g.50894 Transcript_21089/m.50894 type:complete len:209 (+) Transcript_21089:220-846(+)